MPCPERRLLDDIGDVGEARRELALILHQAAAVLDDLGHAAGVEVGQPVLLTAPANEADDALLVIRRPRHLRGEIGAHLEQLFELLVVGVERVVGLRVADQHDLDVERDRLRDQGRRGQHAHLLRQVLDADARVAQSLFQRLPAQRLAQEHPRVQQQIAAVGAMQRAGLDLAIIRDQRAELRAHLDARRSGWGRWGWSPRSPARPADRCCPRSRSTGSDRTAKRPAAAARPAADRPIWLRSLLPLDSRGGSPKVVGVLSQVGLDACEIGEHIRPIGIFRSQLVKERPDGRRGDRLLQAAEPRLRGLFQFLHLTQGPLQRLLQPHAALRSAPRAHFLPAHRTAPG